MELNSNYIKPGGLASLPGYLGPGSTIQKADARPAIDTAIARLEGVIVSLADELNTLQARIEPILSQGPLAAMPNTPMEHEGSSQVGSKIQELATRISGLCFIVRGIRERVEI